MVVLLAKGFRAVDLGVYFYTRLMLLRPYVTHMRRVRYVEWYPRGHLVPQMGERIAPGSILFKEVF